METGKQGCWLSQQSKDRWGGWKRMVGVEAVRIGFWIYFKGNVTGFADGLDTEYWRKRGIKDYKVSDLTSWTWWAWWMEMLIQGCREIKNPVWGMLNLRFLLAFEVVMAGVCRVFKAGYWMRTPRAWVWGKNRNILRTEAWDLRL